MPEYTPASAGRTGVDAMPERPARHYLTTPDSCDTGYVRVPKAVCRVGIKGVKCGSAWCLECGKTVAIKYIRKIEKILSESSALWASHTLTVDREGFPGPTGPIDAYEDMRTQRRVARFVRRGRRRGEYTGVYFWFLEFQGGVWVHVHIGVELTEAFGARLARAARSKGGRDIIKINNEEIAPMWGLGFTQTSFGVDPVKTACYAMAHGVAGGKDVQRGLPIWYDEWREKTGGQRMQKWTFSRGFWDALKDFEGPGDSLHPQSDRRDRMRRIADKGSLVQRPTSVVIQDCGQTDSLVYVEIEATLVDEAGETQEEGYYYHPLGRVPGGVMENVDLLRRAGVLVNEDKEREFSFPLDALASIRALFPAGNWFGYSCLPELGIHCNGYDEVEIVSDIYEGEVNAK